MHRHSVGQKPSQYHNLPLFETAVDHISVVICHGVQRHPRGRTATPTQGRHHRLHCYCDGSALACSRASV